MRLMLLLSLLLIAGCTKPAARAAAIPEIQREAVSKALSHWERSHTHDSTGWQVSTTSDQGDGIIVVRINCLLAAARSIDQHESLYIFDSRLELLYADSGPMADAD